MSDQNSTAVKEKAHALLSPSGAHRWTRCPGSVVLEQQVPNDSSEHARWGSCAHEVAALVLQDAVQGTPPSGGPVWNPENAEAYVGRVFEIDGVDTEFTIEMADCVNDYVAHVESFWEPGDIMLVEQAVPLQHITGEKDATGTSDCVILKLRARELVVIDLKGGRGVQVFAEDEDGQPNEQGVMYADGAIFEHELIYGPFDRVRIVIIQPRLQHVDEIVLDRNALVEAVEVIKVQADRVAEAFQTEKQGGIIQLTPGEKQCRFCNAKAFCPALKDAVGEALHLTAGPASIDEFQDLSIGKQASAAAGFREDGWLGSEDAADKLAKAWKAIPLVEQWVGAVRDTVHTLLHDGKPVGDLCLYEGKDGARAWSDEAEAEALMKKARIKADEMYAKKLITYPAAEKALKKKPVWAKLAPLVTRPDGKPVVGVKGDEKRSPWSPCSPEEFPDLDAAEDPLFQ